ncbi:MAG: lipid-A-disaccharide synthase [Gammaproteobacteria bacterium]|nr:lipid-A-disaccharide synthase [Gammaproteobacteria bacterium]
MGAENHAPVVVTSTPSRPLRIGIVAGEPSGDQLGADLITALRARHPQVIIDALAGPRMRDAGCIEVAAIDELSVMGIVEVLKHYPRLRRLRQRITEYYLSFPPDVFVGIDVPDFVLYVESRLKRAGIPTLHYVCPQVWAWRQSRISAIKRATDCVLALFPFEIPFLARHGVQARFVGHPLADRIPMEIDRESARARLGITPGGPLVALMPGSRRQELIRHLPLFLATADLIARKYPDALFVIGVISSSAAAVVTDYRKRVPSTTRVEVVIQRSRDTLMAADVALCVSGTITLEAALTKTPLVVAYQMPRITFEVLRRLVKTRWIALPNILAERELVPEFIQSAASPSNLAQRMLRWLAAQDEVQAYRSDCRALHQTLRNDAGGAAATAVLDYARARRDSSA